MCTSVFSASCNTRTVVTAVLSSGVFVDGRNHVPSRPLTIVISNPAYLHLNSKAVVQHGSRYNLLVRTPACLFVRVGQIDLEFVHVAPEQFGEFLSEGFALKPILRAGDRYPADHLMI